MAAAGPPRNARWGFAAVVGFFGAPVFAGAAPPQAMRSGSKIVHAAGPRVPVGSSKRCARLDCVLPLNPFCLTGPVRTRPSCNACVRRRL